MSSKMSVDALTDSELRTKLAEYGYPVGPVTQTTRKILVKKLKNIIENRSGAGSRHSLAARYSSDDTDDDSVVVVDKKKKTTTNTRRQTLANPMPPPSSVSTTPIVSRGSRSPSKKKSTRNLEATDTTPLDFVASERTTSKTESRKYMKNYTSSTNDGLETGSDSDVVEETIKYPKTKPGSDAAKSYDYKVQDRNSTESGYSSKSYDTKIRSVHTVRDDKYSSPPFKTNISPIQPTKDDAHRGDGISDILSSYDTPFLSEFTRRLSSQTTVNLPSISKPNVKSSIFRHTSTFPEVKESDTNGHFSSRSAYPSTSSSRYITSTLDRNRDIVNRAYKTSAKSNKDDVKNNQNMISMVLVVVLALFFGILAIVYLGLGGKTDSFPSLPSDSLVPLCTEVYAKQQPGVNCVLKENVDNAFQLLRKVHPILVQRAVSAACDAVEEPTYLSDVDIVEMLASQEVQNFEVREDLYNTQLLIWKNPKWGISLVEIGEDPYDFSEFNTLEKVFMMRLEGKVGMAIMNPDLPMQCLIRRKILTVFSILLIAAFGFLLIIGIYKLAIWYLKYKKNSEREVFQLVSEIISKVELNHQSAMTTSPGGTQESYLAINHVRDNLIPPKDRKKMATLWEKAVKFLDENESRIRREVQQVAGEEFHVWRWLPNNLNTSTNSFTPGSAKKSKVWQGQAFETIEGSVNSLTCSPTPCLKIRHMFNPDEKFDDDWEVKIQDAILEKCGESVKILHIKVDRGSREGCVYLKCMSQEDAGKAYRALHGCWFDGQLVTVKYLRLERYHERFPEARNFMTPLKPSNNQRLSMQAHSWQSPLETN